MIEITPRESRLNPFAPDKTATRAQPQATDRYWESVERR
jgi:hypothetical protein